MTPGYLIVIALAVAVVFAFAHAHNRRQAADETLRSNARCLREFMRMAAMRPHYIVDYQPRRDTK